MLHHSAKKKQKTFSLRSDVTVWARDYLQSTDSMVMFTAISTILHHNYSLSLSLSLSLPLPLPLSSHPAPPFRCCLSRSSHWHVWCTHSRSSCPQPQVRREGPCWHLQWRGRGICHHYREILNSNILCLCRKASSSASVYS